MCVCVENNKCDCALVSPMIILTHVKRDERTYAWRCDVELSMIRNVDPIK